MYGNGLNNKLALYKIANLKENIRILQLCNCALSFLSRTINQSINTA